MAASSAGGGRGKSNSRNVGIPSRAEDNIAAVEHGCSVNGSDIGSWAGMDYDEGREEEFEGGVSGPSSGRYKRKKNDRDERYDSGEDEPEQDKRESAESFIVILRFNDKAQEIMKKLNPLVLTSTLAKVIGDIQYAKVLGDGNLLVKCANGEQVEKALKVKELGKVKVVSSGRVGVRNGGGGKGVITGVHLSVDMEELKGILHP